MLGILSFISSDIIDEKTGKIYFEAGYEIDEIFIQFLNDKKISKIDILKCDNIEIGSYIRNTLQADKARSREEALFEIKDCLNKTVCPDHAVTGFGVSGDKPCEFGHMFEEMKVNGIQL